MRVAVPLRRAWKLLNHGPTTLISARAGAEVNVMSAAWVMAIDFEPPKVAAVVAEGTHTRQLIEASGEFVVSLPTRAQADLAWAVGSVSGRDVDKFARFGIAAAAAAQVAAPLVEGCVAWLECRRLPEPGIGERYDLLIAEVVHAWADDRVFVDGAWRFDGHDELRTIHHLARGTFFTTGERFQAQPLAGAPPA
jgi:flavin reductase (DIM6/NTAB) family NADH-FMN oxidoreductase RutF